MQGIENKVICQECNKAYFKITSTHLKKHGMTLEEYKLKYPYNICDLVSTRFTSVDSSFTKSICK